MSLSMYDATVPVLLRQLGTLSAILDKGDAFAGEKGVDPQDLIDARLAPDMFALARQVQIVSDTAKGAVGRLAGIDMPSFPDEEKTFAELQQRIAKTVDYIRSADAATFEGAETREVTLQAGPRELKFTGQAYLLHFVLPNFFFHVTAAYAILRSKGVPLGKMDYLGAV